MSKCPLAGQGIWPRKGTRGKIHCIEGTLPGKEEESMGSIGKKIFTVAVGLALAAGIPHPATTAGHARSGGGAPMKGGRARHMEEMRATIANLRALEAKMESLKSKADAAAFRAASLEHSKLLTYLQESHLKHMEGMMGGGK